MPRAAVAPVEDEDQGEEGEVQELTLREQIEAARDEIVGDEGDAGGAAADEGQGREPQARPDGAADGGARARDGSGRFAPKAGAEPAAGAQAGTPPGAPSAATDAAAGARQAPGAAAPAVGAMSPPIKWSEQAKAQWQSLPEWARTEIVQREAAVHREITRQDGERTLAKQFTEIVNSYPDVINRAGVHPLRFVSDVMAVMRTMTGGNPAQKVALLRDIAQRNGVDPRALAGLPPAPGQPGAPGANVPPQAPVYQLPPHIASMAREWEQFKTEQTRQAQEANERMASQVLAEIDAFRGDAKNRYFDQVRDHMEVLLAGGAANTLAEAYDMAIHAHPDVRRALEAEATAAAQAEARKREQAIRARARNISVRPRPPSPGSTAGKPPEERTLREELQANFAEARSRL